MKNSNVPRKVRKMFTVWYWQVSNAVCVFRLCKSAQLSIGDSASWFSSVAGAFRLTVVVVDPVFLYLLKFVINLSFLKSGTCVYDLNDNSRTTIQHLKKPSLKGLSQNMHVQNINRTHPNDSWVTTLYSGSVQAGTQGQ